MKKFAIFVPVPAILICLFAACGGKGGDTTGSGGTGTTSSSSKSTTSSTSGTGGSGGGPVMCVDDGNCDFSEDCTCKDCQGTAFCGACMADGMCTTDDACTCQDCWADSICGDPTGCLDDGKCDEFYEGCQCADCKSVANCANYVPPPPSDGGVSDGG
jgi:hypothetical protein